ncbi:hypothetical protein [Limosilactobacillus caccae]|uniref:hypothetical protein n=1 Tax=Limosilactobacillus caccae TaxID=1926284 RepID=UPI0009710842|nr:hypothetical protein [Limosilactobacillus caccae]
MATNLSHDDELRGLLSDIARRRFTTSRQINPHSNLFVTCQDAVDHQYITGAVLDTSFSSRLAELNLTNAKLTPAGQDKLASLINQQTEDK